MAMAHNSPANNAAKLHPASHFGTQLLRPATEIKAGPIPTIRIVAIQSAREANQPMASAIEAAVGELSGESRTTTAHQATKEATPKVTAIQ